MTQIPIRRGETRVGELRLDKVNGHSPTDNLGGMGVTKAVGWTRFSMPVFFANRDRSCRTYAALMGFPSSVQNTVPVPVGAQRGWASRIRAVSMLSLLT